MKTLINWVIGALLLWLMSFIPFMAISFNRWVTILIVAMALGLINALIVPAAKNLFKKSTSLLLLLVSLVIDAAALWLAGLIVPGFTIEFFPTAIIAAVVLSLVNVGFSKASA